MNGYVKEERNGMDTITNTIVAVASKPATGITIGLGATILTWIGVITTVMGCLATIIGVGAAIYSFIYNKRNAKLLELQLKDFEKTHKE